MVGTIFNVIIILIENFSEDMSFFYSKSVYAPMF